MDKDHIKIRYSVERKERWDAVTSVLPFIRFKHDWMIKICPPSGGVLIKFQIYRFDSHKDKFITVVLDFYGSLGNDRPVWEIFPYKDDIMRLDFDDTTDLVAKIEDALVDISASSIDRRKMVFSDID